MQIMGQWEMSRDKVYYLLKECCRKKDLVSGKRLHTVMVQSGLDSIAALGDHLIRLFAYCGCLIGANQSFNNISQPSIYTWNAILSAYVDQRLAESALKLYHKMQKVGGESNQHIYVTMLKACIETSAIKQGRLIHEQIICSGLQFDTFVGGTLVDMYAKCGSVDEAYLVFIGLENKNLVSWSTMIGGYAQHAEGCLALEYFDKMQQEGTKADVIMFSIMMKACGNLGVIERGRYIHEQFIHNELQPDVFVGSSLVGMYAKCGSFEEAKRIFGKWPVQNTVMWNTMIAACNLHDKPDISLEYYNNMMKADALTFSGILKACGTIRAIGMGRFIHEQVIESGLQSSVPLKSAIVDMYAKCGNLEEACLYFDKFLNLDIVLWNTMIAAYVQHSEPCLAIECFEHMRQELIEPSMLTFSSTLKACGSIGGIERGRYFHEQIINKRLQSDVIMGSTLVDMYAKCGSFEEACKVLDELLEWNVISVTAMIDGCAQHSEGFLALKYYEEMQERGIKPNSGTFLSMIKACGSVSLEWGRCIHEQVIESGHPSIPFGAPLIDMYNKQGSLREAREVFDQLTECDVASWGAMIAAYTQHDECLNALRCFDKMLKTGISPSIAIFSACLKACGSIGAIDRCRSIHQQIIDNGGETSVFLGSILLDMYAKHGNLKEACKVFNNISDLDVVSWGGMIAGYVRDDNAFLAIQCFEKMQAQGLKSNAVVFSNILKACGSIDFIEKGRYIHAQIMETGVWKNIFVGSSLVDMYGKCGSLIEAQRAFDLLPSPNVVSWGALIAGYTHERKCHIALRYFDDMQYNDIEPDTSIFSIVLTACSVIEDLNRGRYIHEQIIANRFHHDPFIEGSLVTMYAKCGSMVEACTLVDRSQSRNMVSWGAMIAGYVQQGRSLRALECFDEMQKEGLSLDSATASSIFMACSACNAVQKGRCVHEQIIEEGFQYDLILKNILVDMYAKCGSLEEACQNFQNLSKRNVMSWNTMIAGYVQHCEGQLAMECFYKMQHDGSEPNVVTFSLILKLCSKIGAMCIGRSIHEQITNIGFQSDISVGTGLVDMYSRCGSLREAEIVFSKLLQLDVVGFGAMTTGYAEHGNVILAVKCLETMTLNRIGLNETIFTAILTACSHVGLVDEGHWYFSSMRQSDGVTPNIIHYNCMVHLFARAGFFFEAVKVFDVTAQPNVVGWMALLSACKIHDHVQLGRECFSKILTFISSHVGAFTLMSHIFAANYIEEGPKNSKFNIVDPHVSIK